MSDIKKDGDKEDGGRDGEIDHNNQEGRAMSLGHSEDWDATGSGKTLVNKNDVAHARMRQGELK